MLRSWWHWRWGRGGGLGSVGGWSWRFDFLLGLWVLLAMPQPGVDVCLFQREACRTLLSGQNPYTMTFANLYSDASRVYGPGTFAGDRLLFGYPYPPLSLLLILPGHLLGDFRFSHLVATTAAGALIAAVQPGRIATLGATLFLFTPRGFFVLEAGWTEPLAVLLLAAVVYFACRDEALLSESRSNAGWMLPLSLGLLLVVKQYLILIAPLAVWFSWPGRVQLRRQLFVASLVATCLIVPMALWNIRGFLWSVVLLQFHQPVRPDALSFLPSLIEWTHIPGMTALRFIIALAWRPGAPCSFPAPRLPSRRRPHSCFCCFSRSISRRSAIIITS